ncbi:multidrug efflux MFS transporter [Sulfobacillus sp. DSM 109850]|uniref:Multidrug efflux MFS transporter n=2 Tax=Sulfobacillus harzensis TaxID=2729629 RepID=A0A7Y0L6Q3_9FIRM|nr:multidrug efflux MFS transporter [Sulfobacillus harzensis]
MTVMLVGTFVAILNETLLNVALPRIMQDFHVTANAVQWLTTVYMLTNGVLIPVTAFLVQKFSLRRLFMTGMGLFAMGSLVAGLAPDFGLLLSARVMQAAGAAIVLPLLMNVILTIYPLEQRGSAMGLVGLVITFAPAIGPTLSGWLVTHHSWHLLFFIVLPIALLDVLFAYTSLANVLPNTNPDIDAASILLSTLGFGGLLFGFSEAGSIGWHAPLVWVSLLVALASLGIFVRRQFFLKMPMLEFRVFRVRQFTLATVVTVLVFMSMFSAMLLLPLYLQNARGFSPLASGLLVMPGAVAMGIMSPISGRIFDKVGGRWLGIVGSLFLAGTLFDFTSLSTSTGYVTLMIAFVFLMLGMSLIMMPVMTSGLNWLPPELYPHGTAVSNTLQQVAGAVGTALLVTIMTDGAKAWVGGHGQAVLAHRQNPAVVAQLASIHGMDLAFMTAAGFALLSLVLCFFVQNSTPHPEA